jgi:hypothetical protein
MNKWGEYPNLTFCDNFNLRMHRLRRSLMALHTVASERFSDDKLGVERKATKEES